MATANEGLEFADHLARQLVMERLEAAIIFRRHPRDSITDVEYEQVFASHGIELVKCSSVTTTEVGSLADCIVTTTSVEGLHAIYRRKPVVYCYDAAYVSPRAGLVPPPPVVLGAAFGAQTVNELPAKLRQALTASAHEGSNWRQAMQLHYPLDGHNVDRVVGVIDTLLER